MLIVYDVVSMIRLHHNLTLCLKYCIHSASCKERPGDGSCSLARANSRSGNALHGIKRCAW
jgi:hypothetical protein